MYILDQFHQTLYTRRRLLILKSHNKFHANISIKKGLLSEDIFWFPDIVENPGQNKNVTGKIISDRKEVSEKRNDTETDFS